MSSRSCSAVVALSVTQFLSFCFTIETTTNRQPTYACRLARKTGHGTDPCGRSSFGRFSSDCQPSTLFLRNRSGSGELVSSGTRTENRGSSLRASCLARCGQHVSVPNNVLKDPFVLEFLDLKENLTPLERHIEQAIIDRLKDYFLEMGKGLLLHCK